MAELILNVKTLPEHLLNIIHTEKVKVEEVNGEIRLTPVLSENKGCPLLGLAADSNVTVGNFMGDKKTEKAFEL